MKLGGGEECQGCHLVIKQGKISIKRKTLLVWFWGGFCLFVFSAIGSVRVINVDFVLVWLGFWGFFDAWKKNKYNIFQRAVLNIHCSGLVRLLSNLCMVIGFILPL